MDFGFDDEQLLLSDTLREFALSELAPVAERWRTEPFPRELIGRLGELGLLGLRIPAEYGGSDGSYVAANDPRVSIGLGTHAGPVDVEVTWADGTRTRHTDLAIGRYHRIVRP